jgi:hypothetical protein
LFKKLGSDQGPITLPKCYLRLQSGLSVPSVFNQLQIVKSLSSAGNGAPALSVQKCSSAFFFAERNLGVEALAVIYRQQVRVYIPGLQSFVFGSQFHRI